MNRGQEKMQNNCCLRWHTRRRIFGQRIEARVRRKRTSFVVYCLWQNQLRLRHLCSTADSFITQMDYSLSTFRTKAPGDNVVYLGLKELLCRGLASHNAIGLKAFFVHVRSKRQQWSRRPNMTYDLRCDDGDEQKKWWGTVPVSLLNFHLFSLFGCFGIEWHHHRRHNNSNGSQNAPHKERWKKKFSQSRQIKNARFIDDKPSFFRIINQIDFSAFRYSE